MTGKTQIARTAVTKALRLRARLGVSPNCAVDPVDLAARLGIQVHFEPLPSLEGIYVAGRQPRIILGSDRPSGRRNFTCAHEIGHDAHGHGSRVDEYRPEGKTYDPQEFAADRFAAALLMPKIGVQAVFATRGWDIRKPTPEHAYIVSAELGVGYSTLAGYLSGTLELISDSRRQFLRRQLPRQIRTAIVGRNINQHLVIVDTGWRRPEVDLEVGDVVILSGSLDDPEGHLREQPRASGRVTELTAISPGEGRFCTPNCSGAIRIAPRCYKGLSDYRFLSSTHDTPMEAPA